VLEVPPHPAAIAAAAREAAINMTGVRFTAAKSRSPGDRIAEHDKPVTQL
jgi:hypothetical protein